MDGGALRQLELALRKAREGCAFILDNGGSCGAECRPGSPYCAQHHSLCHVREGSTGERRRLNESEALATAVGGRQPRRARLPSNRFLDRLERLVRGLPRPNCSRIVRKGDR